MTPITKDSVIENGFILEYGQYKKSIRNWKVVITFYDDKPRMEIEADGGDWNEGSFDLDHFTTIEQIDALIYAMKGGALGIEQFDKEDEDAKIIEEARRNTSQIPRSPEEEAFCSKIKESYKDTSLGFGLSYIESITSLFDQEDQLLYKPNK